MEVWKSSVVIEHINFRGDKKKERNKPDGDFVVLARVLREKGIQGMWTGLPARMLEGFFSGAVLLAAKEALRTSLGAVPIISPTVVGFVAGAGGGAAQALVMAPCSLLVTATTANGGSVLDAAKDVWGRCGLRGVYSGSSAVAFRQATNWASRQGFTELARPRIKVGGVAGEILAGCVGGTLSCWNTPFESARIEMQSSAFGDASSTTKPGGLAASLSRIVEKRGVGGLYTGLLPRICQACYQTVFLVCVPRLLG